MEPTYQASVLLMIGGGLDVPNPDRSSLQTSEALAATYAELVKTRPVIEGTVAALGLPEKPDFVVSLVRNTQLMRLTVSDSDAQRAADTANELGRQLILQSPSAPEREEQAYRAFVGEQLEELQGEIASLSQAVEQAQEAGQVAEAERFQEELNARRERHAAYLSFIKGSSINYISVRESAVAPSAPTAPKVMQNTLLAAVVGVMLAAGAAFLIEYLDDSVKGRGDVEQILGLASMGLIAEISTNGGSPAAVTLAHPKSPYSEAYRMLRTNLRYALPASTAEHLFLVTSVGPGEGKTTTVSNLAVVLAQAGQRTIIVDADFRRPTLHKVLGCSREVGLSSLLVGETSSLDEALQPVGVDNLSVLASGPIPPNPAELLGSPRMSEVLRELAERADVVLLDSPPVLAVTDASVLASMVSGTLLVVQAGRTRLPACAQAVQALQTVGGNLLGVVLNRLQFRRGDYYSKYYYYYYDRGDGEGPDGGRSGRRRKRRTASSDETN